MAVEAHSLSSITALAANPPKYPRNPAAEVRKPLVLYIARVPGSRDVFLTTVKPRQKVVTAEDVSSSLYYLHVDQPDEMALTKKVEEEVVVGERKDVVVRKPLPLSLSPTMEISPEVPKRPDFHESNPSLGNVKATKRKPIKKSDSVRESTGQMEIRRRPLGPRSEGSSQLLSRRPLPGLETRTVQSERVDNFKALVPPLPPRPRAQTVSTPEYRPLNADLILETGTTNYLRPSSRDGYGTSTDTRRFSITLIRRDPASGGQWNVGKIDATPNTGSLSECESQTSKLTVQIDITNAGYNKFLLSKKAVVPQTPYELDQDVSGRNNVDGELESEDVFRRQISGEVLGSWLSYSLKRRLGSSDLSAGSRNDPEKDISGSSVSLSPRKLVDGDGGSRNKGFTFLSPWDGTCEFFVGASGRSLKCKHTVISTSSEAAPTTNVSELRINLGGPLMRPAIEAVGGEFSNRQPFRKQLSSQVSPLLNMVHETGRLDLSLGQEKAGGGNGGKRAKLGKLIVEDEGLKMLDLIVAANMGMWWKAYDRQT